MSCRFTADCTVWAKSLFIVQNGSSCRQFTVACLYTTSGCFSLRAIHTSESHLAVILFYKSEVPGHGSYIAASFRSDVYPTYPKYFELGDGGRYGSYYNRELVTDQEYRVFVRAVVESQGNVGVNYFDTSCFAAHQNNCQTKCKHASYH